MFVCSVNEGFPTSHQALTACGMCKKDVMPRCCCWSSNRLFIFFFFFIGAVVRVRAETIWTTRKCSTNLEKSKIKRRKRNVIDSSRTFVTADLTLLLASGAIWGLFLNFIFNSFSLLVKWRHLPAATRNTLTPRVLLDKNSHPFNKKTKQKEKKKEINHITLAMATLMKEQQFKYSWSVFSKWKYLSANQDQK